MHRLRSLVASNGFRSTILFLIIVNAFAMGLEASPAAVAQYATALEWVFLSHRRFSLPKSSRAGRLHLRVSSFAIPGTALILS